jgi:hypothetical protein
MKEFIKKEGFKKREPKPEPTEEEKEDRKKRGNPSRK